MKSHDTLYGRCNLTYQQILKFHGTSLIVEVVWNKNEKIQSQFFKILCLTSNESEHGSFLVENTTTKQQYNLIFDKNSVFECYLSPPFKQTPFSIQVLLEASI